MLRRLSNLALLVSLVACGDSAGPGTGPVASVAIVSGDLQTGPAYAELPNPLVVRVLDADGKPVQGQVVNFRVVTGNGSVFAGSGSSNAKGLVQERWTLGPVSADTQRVEARAVDPATGEPIVFAVFRAIATPEDGSPPEGRLVFVTPFPHGGTPEVVIGQAYPYTAWVVAFDWTDQPIPGVELSFSVTGGGGVGRPTARTGNDGIAYFDYWTLGPVPGLNTLSVSAPGFRPDTIEATGITRAGFHLAPPASDLAVDSMVQLAATRLDAAGNPMPEPGPVHYRSLDPTVATVSSGGLVTGVATGQTRIVATSDPFADTVAVTVAMSFTSVSAGWGTCAIRPDGEGRCWGRDDFGQLGDGPVNSSGTASVPVAGGLTFRQIRTTRSHINGFSCGLTTGGSVYCWGSNSAGQLGNGGPSADSPQPVAGGLTFTALDVGAEHVCGIAAGGKAYCWGGNSHGQLGTGDSTSRAQPTAVAGDLRFSAIGTGSSHTCAVADGGAAYCWGASEDGQLGQGTTEGSPVPVPVSGGLTFADVKAGSSHSCGLTTAGAAYCWGQHVYGQIGHGTFDLSDVLTPALVAGGKSWIAISAGSIVSCGITTDGSAYCWGHSGSGNLGNGSWDSGIQHPAPELVVGGQRFTSISVGSLVCGVTTRPGTPIYCWGISPALVTGF